MKKLIFLLLLLPILACGQSRKIDTLYLKNGILADSTGAKTITTSGKSFLVFRGQAGIWYVTPAGEKRLDIIQGLGTDTTKFLRNDGNWVVPAGGGTITGISVYSPLFGGGTNGPVFIIADTGWIENGMPLFEPDSNKSLATRGYVDRKHIIPVYDYTDSIKFLRQDSTWAILNNVPDYENDETLFLRSDSTWAVPPGGGGGGTGDITEVFISLPLYSSYGDIGNGQYDITSGVVDIWADTTSQNWYALVNQHQASHKVGDTTQVRAGRGITGGGQLTTSRTFNVDTTLIAKRSYTDSVAGWKVDSTRQIITTADSGLSGGRNLNGNVTLKLDTASTRFKNGNIRRTVRPYTGGTTNFLREDSTWAAVPGSSGTITQVQARYPLMDTTSTGMATVRVDTANGLAMRNWVTRTKVDTGLTLTAGTGLTGGGKLTANRTFSADLSVLANHTYADTVRKKGLVPDYTKPSGTLFLRQDSSWASPTVATRLTPAYVYTYPAQDTGWFLRKDSTWQRGIGTTLTDSMILMAKGDTEIVSTNKSMRLLDTANVLAPRYFSSNASNLSSGTVASARLPINLNGQAGIVPDPAGLLNYVWGTSATGVAGWRIEAGGSSASADSLKHIFVDIAGWNDTTSYLSHDTTTRDGIKGKWKFRNGAILDSASWGTAMATPRAYKLYPKTATSIGVMPDSLSGTNPTFDLIGAGTNINKALIIGSGSSLNYSGSGTINASSFRGNTTIAIANGGTNATTTLNNGRMMISSGGGIIEHSARTPLRVVISSYLPAAALDSSSAVTATELSYLTGVTSAIQTQLGTKAPNASPTFTGTLTLTGSTLSGGMWNSGTIGTTPTMSLGSDATGDVYYRNSSGYLTRLGVSTNGYVLTLNAGLPTWLAPSGGGSTAFSAITGSTNTTAAMVVGSGATLGYIGTGTIDANKIFGSTVSGISGSGANAVFSVAPTFSGLTTVANLKADSAYTPKFQFGTSNTTKQSLTQNGTNGGVAWGIPDSVRGADTATRAYWATSLRVKPPLSDSATASYYATSIRGTLDTAAKSYWSTRLRGDTTVSSHYSTKSRTIKPIAAFSIDSSAISTTGLYPFFYADIGYVIDTIVVIQNGASASIIPKVIWGTDLSAAGTDTMNFAQTAITTVNTTVKIIPDNATAATVTAGSHIWLRTGTAATKPWRFLLTLVGHEQ